MQVGDLVMVNDHRLTDTIYVVRYIGQKATLLYNSVTQQEEWFNNFIWQQWMEVICK